MPANDDLSFVLHKMKLFKGLTNDELLQIAPYGRQVQFETGKKVIREGEEKPGLFVLMTGEMEVILPKNPLQKDRLSNILLSTIKRGDYVGEYSLIDQQPASATVMAKEKSLLFHMPCRDFEKLIKEHPAITIKIYRNMLEELVARARNYDQELDLIV